MQKHFYNVEKAIKEFIDIEIIMAAINSGLALIGYIIIPITNSARDRSWDGLFTFLHRLSVYITISIFIFSITEIVRISLA